VRDFQNENRLALIFDSIDHAIIAYAIAKVTSQVAFKEAWCSHDVVGPAPTVQSIEQV
jgi:hypothetical protein